MQKTVLTRLALATLLATGLTTTVWAAKDGPETMYRMPSGKLTNVFPARKAAAQPKATAPAAKPAKPAAPKPQKKVNFTTKRKK